MQLNVLCGGMLRVHSLSTDAASQQETGWVNRYQVGLLAQPIHQIGGACVLVVAIAPCNVAPTVLHFILDLVSLCQTVAHDEHEYAKERESVSN